MRRFFALSFAIIGLFFLAHYGITEAQTISCGSPTTLTISGSLGSAYQNVPYTKALQVSGGTPCVAPATYTWSVIGSLPTGLSLTNTNQMPIAGTPTGTGPSLFTVQVLDCGGAAQQKAQTVLTVNVNTLNSVAGIAVSPTTISVAVNAISAAPSSTLTFSDGTTLSGSGLVTWSATPSSFCTVNVSTGAVTGVAGGNCAETASFSGQTSNSINVTVTGGTPPPTPSLIPATLPQGYLSEVYPSNVCVVASGGTPPYTAYAKTGSLPTGMSFSTSTGCITGTPTSSGTFPFTATVTDNASQTSPAVQYSLMVNTVNSAVALTLPGGATAITLANSGTAQLNTPVCTWSDGSHTQCPSSLTYSSDSTGVATVGSTTGLITAASSGTGTAHITASVSGCGGTCTSNQITVTVAASLSISTASLPNGQQGFAYPEPGSISGSNQLGASGGTGPYTFSCNAGACSSYLPTGLSLSSGGLITGTLGSAATTATVVFKVTDSLAATATRSLTITVATASGNPIVTPSAPSISVGATQQFQANQPFSDGSSQNVTSLLGSGVQLVTKVTATGAYDGSTYATVASPVFNLISGNLVYVDCEAASPAVSFTVSDTAGNTYTSIGSKTDSFADIYQHFYAKNATANAADIVTCTPNISAGYQGVLAIQYSGLDTSTPLDTHTEVTSGRVSQCTAGPATTSNANDLIVVFGGVANNGLSFTAGSPFNLELTTTVADSALEDEDVSAVQTGIQPTLSYSPGGTFCTTMLAAFKAAASSSNYWAISAASGSPTYVQGHSTFAPNPYTGVDASSPTVVTNTLGSSTPVGNLLLVWVDWDCGAGCATNRNLASVPVTDDAGNTYTQIGTQENYLGSGPSYNADTSALFYAVNKSAGTRTVTFNVTAVGDGTFIGSGVFEYSGINPSNPIDAFSWSLGTTANAGSSVTTSSPNETFLSILGVGGSGTWVAGACCTSRFSINTSSPLVGLEDAIAATPGSQTINWVFSMQGSGQWGVSLNTNSVATINSSGLAMGHAVGAATVTAHYAGNSGTASLTVTNPSDASLTISPNPASGTVNGSAVTFQAIGNPSGANDTAGSNWSSGNQNIFRFTSGSTGNCVAAGSTTVTATFGSINGMAAVNCSTVTATSLLSGCTVSASNAVNYSQTGCPSGAPAGWTVVFADGSSNGSVAGSVIYSGTNLNCPAPGSGHGTSAYCTDYSYNGAQLLVSAPPVTAAGHQYYLSFWDYVDSNALYPSNDYQYGGFIPFWGSTTCASAVMVGANNELNPGAASATTGQFISGGIGTVSSGCAGLPNYHVVFNPTINAGSWRQYEMLYIPNTTVTLPESNPSPICTSSSVPGCGNGTVKIWINGQLVMDYENANLNSVNTVTKVDAAFGGFFTSFNASQTSACPSLNASCPGPTPGTGAPNPFNRYINSLIEMTQ